MAPLGAFVIMTASCVSLVRVLLEIAAAAPGIFVPIAVPVSVMLAVCVAVAAILYARCRREESPMPEQKNPAEFKGALVFGLLYALILLAVAAARDHFGEAGLFAVAALSGLTDMDAITLSTAQLAQSGALPASSAWRAIVIAIMANFTFKFIAVAIIGSRALTFRVAAAFAAAVLCGGVLVGIWPW